MNYCHVYLIARLSNHMDVSNKTCVILELRSTLCRHLYRKMQEKMLLQDFRLVDPMPVEYVPSRNQNRDFIQEQLNKRACYLSSRLIGTSSGQLVVVPCNVGWVRITLYITLTCIFWELARCIYTLIIFLCVVFTGFWLSSMLRRRLFFCWILLVTAFVIKIGNMLSTCKFFGFFSYLCWNM